MKGESDLSLLVNFQWVMGHWQSTGRFSSYRGKESFGKKMDCCPIMVSDLPVMCSRIDGVVTVVKAHHPNSACPDLYWGKFHRVHNAVLF